MRTTHRWEENYYKWSGRHFVKRSDEQQEAEIAEFLYNDVRLLTKNRQGETVTCQPKATHILETLRALRNRTLINARPPCWIGDAPAGYDFTHAITVRNGILLPGGEPTLLRPSPGWFTLTALGTDYDPEATCPNWDEFLLQLWPDDPQSISTLQEIFGYIITNDMSLEKIFALIGPPRSGKGTIANTLKGLLGEGLHATQGLSKLAEGFESEVIIGKTLLVIPDARLGNKTDVAKLLELFLAISGGDNPGIPRKYREAYTGPLYVRFLVLSNEVPRLPDASGAAAKRFIVLKTFRDFTGNEDTTFKETMRSELPGVLNWALTGWVNLQERGFFIQPESARDEIEMIADAGNPLRFFVEDACQLGDPKDEKFQTPKDEVYDAYLRQCEDLKVKDPLRRDTFFRKLKEAYPTVRDYRPEVGQGKKRPRSLIGIRVLREAERTGKRQ